MILVEAKEIEIVRTERQAALMEVPLLSQESTTGSLNSGA